jgi:hypothetical protein
MKTQMKIMVMALAVLALAVTARAGRAATLGEDEYREERERARRVTAMPVVPVGTRIILVPGQTPQGWPGKWMAADGGAIPFDDKHETLNRLYNGLMPDLNRVLVFPDFEGAGQPHRAVQGHNVLYYIRSED